MMEIQDLFHKGGSLADLLYKEKERKSRSWEIAEETTREEYTLDWAQSKVFLVTYIISHQPDIIMFDCPIRVYEA